MAKPTITTRRRALFTGTGLFLSGAFAALAAPVREALR
jgi:hypothetical protein